MSLSIGHTPADDANLPHPSQDTSRRFANDQLLRAHGFAIRSRPRKGQPTWTRGGEVFTQEEALALARLEKAGKRRECRGK